MTQSTEQAPFTSESVGSSLAMDSCEKSLSTFVGSLRFPPTGKVDRVG